VSQPGGVGEYTVINRQRLHEEAYRWEVVADLMRDYGDAFAQYCLTWLGEGLAVDMRKQAVEKGDVRAAAEILTVCKVYGTVEPPKMAPKIPSWWWCSGAGGGVGNHGAATRRSSG
jgi:hypothetical protein